MVRNKNNNNYTKLKLKHSLKLNILIAYNGQTKVTSTLINEQVNILCCENVNI